MNAKHTGIPPHVTLVNRFETNSIQTIIEKLKELYIEDITIHITRISYFLDPAILYFDIENTLQTVHEDILDVIKPHVNPITRFKSDALTQKQKEFLEVYGSPFVKEFYHPHISLTSNHADPDLFKDAIKNLPQISFKTKAKLAIIIKTQDAWEVNYLN